MTKPIIVDTVMDIVDWAVYITNTDGKLLASELEAASKQGFTVKIISTFIQNKRGKIVPFTKKKKWVPVYCAMSVTRGKHELSIEEYDLEGDEDKATLKALRKAICFIRIVEERDR